MSIDGVAREYLYEGDRFTNQSIPLLYKKSSNYFTFPYEDTNLLIFWLHVVPQEIQKRLQGELSCENIRNFLDARQISIKNIELTSGTVTLHELPREICQLDPSTIKMSGCGMKNVAWNMSQLKNLQKLDLSHNRLVAIPRGLEMMKQQKIVVDLSHNPIKNYPEKIGDLIHYNQIEFRGKEGLYMSENLYCKTLQENIGF
jgi:hypothetical protein